MRYNNLTENKVHGPYILPPLKKISSSKLLTWRN